MGLALAPEVWGVIVVAASLCGWLLGDVHGALRRYAAEEVAAEEAETLFTVAVAPKTLRVGSAMEDREPQAQPQAQPQPRSAADPLAMPVAAKPNEADALSPEPARSIIRTKPGQVSHLAPSESRESLFAGMPPLAELRAQTRRILETNDVWGQEEKSLELADFKNNADLMSLALLRNYRRSIEELQLSSASRAFSDDASGPAPMAPAPMASPLGSQIGQLGPEHPSGHLGNVGDLNSLHPMTELLCQTQEQTPAEPSLTFTLRRRR